MNKMEVSKMANQLDEMNPEIMSEGRDVHVIAKVIPVETSGFEKLIPTILMAIGVIGIVLGIVIDKYLISAIGVVVLVYPWWRLKQISSEFNMMEQRVVILSNAAKLVEKSIEVDKDILVDIAKYRSGNFSEESRSDVNAQLNKATRALNVAIENYPELQSQDTIRDAMQQNSYLQKEITAARTLYNDAVNTWNREIFEFPFKKIVAAKEGRTTRIPFIADQETKEKAKGVFF